jgi:UDP-N-acetylglucosamine--N-acetylmuramyl-(pentapeptide) pyrophosphoryl-undecaprenol N-acetylglucosamine transferase
MSGNMPAVLLAAGGTGGHLFPAEALANELMAHGVAVELVTDYRGKIFSSAFPAQAIHQLSSATIKSRKPLDAAQAGAKMAQGMAQALWLLVRRKPKMVVGFGGYPTVPPVLMAQMLRIPTIIHEQNAVLGRANRFLAKRAKVVATGFAQLNNVDEGIADRLVHAGNPVRPAVFAAAANPYPVLSGEGSINLLVVGGSQGARVMTEIVPAAVQRLDAGLRQRLNIVQQAREDDLAWARAAYAAAGVQAEVASFFKDLPQRISNAHLVIGRSGASTVAELATIGRPSVLVPLPGSLDQDQFANARILETLGGTKIYLQAQFTPEALAAELTALFAEPVALAQMANNAQAAASPQAAARLAKLVLDVVNYSSP